MGEFSFLTDGVTFVVNNPKTLVMWLIGGLLIWLAIKKDFEPALLLPMGFGAIWSTCRCRVCWEKTALCSGFMRRELPLRRHFRCFCLWASAR